MNASFIALDNNSSSPQLQKRYTHKNTFNPSLVSGLETVTPRLLSKYHTAEPFGSSCIKKCFGLLRVQQTVP